MLRAPKTYEEWKHCITIDCGIHLTQKFVKERIEALNDVKDFHTQKFIESWGMDHHAQTLVWFHRASEELNTQTQSNK